MLKNIKNNSPYIFIDNSAIQETLGHSPDREFKAITWNKDVKQTYWLFGGIEAKDFMADVKSIVLDGGHKHRLFCNKTLVDFISKRCDSIKDEWLNNLPSQRGILHLNQNIIIYNIVSTPSEVQFSFYSLYVQHTHVSMKIEGKILKEPQELVITNYLGAEFKMHEPNFMQRAISASYLRALFFLQFAEVETKIVNNKNRKVKIGDDKVINRTEFQIEVIDSTYYTNIIRTESFNVTGHFRWQPFGQGRSLVKLIYIKDFEKEGYERKAKITQQETTT